MYTGVVLMRNKKVLLMKKKQTNHHVRTIPFTLAQDQYPQSAAIQVLRDHLYIDVDPQMLTQHLVINKVDKNKNHSLGYFSLCIQRDWEIKNRLKEQFHWFDRFAQEDFPEAMTPDMKTILEHILDGQKYIELNHE